MSGMHGLGTFGRYLLVEELAAGGMGRVYRAVLRGGPGFEKQVALKRVLREFGEDEEFVGRFADEARIASTLSHGNIVQVFDFGELDGEYYLAMELVDGPDLGSLIGVARGQQRRLPVPAALFIASELCRGLAAAHHRLDGNGEPAPVVHRDVSPQNVMLARDGGVKVTDFGIAKAADKALRTQTGMLMGKVRYMAPEQARAEVVDARADVFAAGCVLFEMLVGRPLFDGRSPEEVLLKVVQQPIPRISEVVEGIPPGLDAILERALERERSLRYADGGAFARDLERLLHVIAPGYSQDDLAALIEDLAPRQPSVHQRPTRPLEPGEALVAHPTLADEAGLAAALSETAFAAEELAAGDRTATMASAGGEDLSYAPTEVPESADDPRDATDAYHDALAAELAPPSVNAVRTITRGSGDATPAPHRDEHRPSQLPTTPDVLAGQIDPPRLGEHEAGVAPTSAEAVEVGEVGEVGEPASPGSTPPDDVELLLHPRPPTLIGPKGAGEPTAPLDEPQPGPGRRLALAALIALALGGGAGVAAAMVLPPGSPAPQPAIRTPTLGAALSLGGGVEVTLHGAKLVGPRLVVAVSFGSGPAPSCALRDREGRSHPPRHWQLLGSGKRRLVFEAPAKTSKLWLELRDPSREIAVDLPLAVER